ncbi:hypothetical protein V8C34DRAFT_288000 [Trichoderma compactum]
MLYLGFSASPAACRGFVSLTCLANVQWHLRLDLLSPRPLLGWHQCIFAILLLSKGTQDTLRIFAFVSWNRPTSIGGLRPCAQEWRHRIQPSSCTLVIFYLRKITHCSLPMFSQQRCLRAQFLLIFFLFVFFIFSQVLHPSAQL